MWDDRNPNVVTEMGFQGKFSFNLYKWLNLIIQAITNKRFHETSFEY